jgi:hypothetical protein
MRDDTRVSKSATCVHVRAAPRLHSAPGIFHEEGEAGESVVHVASFIAVTTRSAHDLWEVRVGRLHPPCGEARNECLPVASRHDPRSPVREVSGAADQLPRDRHAALPALPRESRRLTATRRPPWSRGTGVAAGSAVDPDSESYEDATADDPVVHRFTVFRGMKIVVVIETRDWYSGLLQAAMARARIDGQN